jgi:putative hemolysin
MVLDLLDDPKTLMSSVLVGTNLTVIGCTSTFTALVARFYGESGTSISTAVLVPLFLVFAEMLPKGVFLYYGSKAAVQSVIPLRLLTVLMYPVVKLFSLITDGLMRMMRLHNRMEGLPITMDALLYHLEDSKEAGLITKETMALASRALAMKQLSAGEMIIPADQVVMVKDGLTLEEYKEIFAREEFTRLPVYRRNRNNVIGILSIHNLIRAIEPRYGKLELEEPYFVQKDTPIVRMLSHMQNQGCQMALVKDAERIIGMLTLENILEQLVGTIADEYH